MANTKTKARNVPPDIDLLVASVSGTKLPNHLVEAAFWWEYMRSSAHAIAAIRRASSQDYWPARARSHLTRIVDPGLLIILGRGLKNHFGEEIDFPDMSWFDAMQTHSLPGEEHPGGTVAEFWNHWVHFVQPPIVLIKESPSCTNDDNISRWKLRRWGKRYNYHIEVNWSYSNHQLMHGFWNQIKRLRPNSNPRRGFRPALSKIPLPVNPRSALGWLFILRARASCKSWSDFLNRYRPVVRQELRRMPDETELMSRCRRALKIVGWFESGKIAPVH